MVVPTTFVGPIVPTNVVGTKIHINCLMIGQFNFKVLLGSPMYKRQADPIFFPGGTNILPHVFFY